jgi:hypothetical protein
LPARATLEQSLSAVNVAIQNGTSMFDSSLKADAEDSDSSNGFSFTKAGPTVLTILTSVSFGPSFFPSFSKSFSLTFFSPAPCLFA